MRSSRLALFVPATRFAIGFVWIAGASFNLGWSLRHASAFSDSLATGATFALFRRFFGDVVATAPGFWIAGLILVEIALGVLTLGRGRPARLGLAGSAVFSGFLFLIIWPYTLMMAGWALLALWLLRYDHPVAITDLVRPRISAGRHAAGKGAR